MREIKFRAWHKKRKEWVEKDACSILGEIILCGAWLSGVSLSELNDIEVLEYTGLKSKSGKEIYEGDIVIVDSCEPSNYQVKFIEGGFCTCDDKGQFCFDLNFHYPSKGCEIEIIGNIYENQELLKETKCKNKS